MYATSTPITSPSAFTSAPEGLERWKRWAISGVTSVGSTPRNACTAFPVAISCRTSSTTVPAGIAKPIETA